MPLFWIVNDVKGARRVFIAEAGAPVFARLRAALAGHAGEFAEIYELDAKTAKKIPRKRSAGFWISAKAQKLLQRL